MASAASSCCFISGPRTRYSNGLADLPHLKVVADRFGKDERFTMVSFCLVDDPDVAVRIIKLSAGYRGDRPSSGITALTRSLSTTIPFQPRNRS